MKIYVYLVAVLSSLFFSSCMKRHDELQQPEQELLLLPPPIDRPINYKNVLWLSFDTITVPNHGGMWNLQDSITHFKASGLSYNNRVFIRDSLQREVKRCGANLYVTFDDKLAFDTATGIKAIMIFTETDVSVVTQIGTPVGLAIINSLTFGDHIGSFVFTTWFKKTNSNGIFVEFDLGRLARTVIHEFGHMAGLYHCIWYQQHWMYPMINSVKNGFFATSVTDVNGDVVNQQNLIHNSVPARMNNTVPLEHKVLTEY